MKYSISVTQENTKTFPIHSHETWELMCYIEGEGFLRTEKGDIPFSKDTVIAVPPGIKHGSVSVDTFVNICFHADIAMHKKEIYHIPKASTQTVSLFKNLRDFCFSSENYENVITNLITALSALIEISCRPADLNSKIKKVYDEISTDFLNKDFSLQNLIASAGYVDDYFRSIFLKQYGITPKGYLDKLRIEYAAGLIKTYGNSIKMYEIAQWCGYSDPLYFSRRFKKYFGESPQNYLKGVLCNEKD